MLTWNHKSGRTFGGVQTMTEKVWKQNRKKDEWRGKQKERAAGRYRGAVCWLNFLYMGAMENFFSIFNDFVPPGTYVMHVG